MRIPTALTLFTATLACVLGMSLSAQAALVDATFTCSPSCSVPVSSTITLTTIGDPGIDPVTMLPATADLIFGRLLYDASLVTANSGTTQTKLRETGGAKWTTGPLLIGGNFSDAFNQIKPNELSAIPADSTKKLTSVMTFTMGNTTGVAVFAWDIAGSSFFNHLTTWTAPTITIVPEPTTAVLMGLGLLGLVVVARRR